MRASPKDVRRDLIDFALILGQEVPRVREDHTSWLSDMLVRLCEINNALDALNEAGCNYGLTPRQEKRNEKLDAEAIARCRVLGLGFDAKLTGDPRGVPIKVILPSGRSNSFVGDGWCVPLTR
jgi:hypothetical protein